MNVTENWNQLEEAVLSAIDSGHIGTPCAVRITIHAPKTECGSEPLFKKTVTSVERWFGIDATETPSTVSDDLNASLLRWKSGATGLISVSVAVDGRFGGHVTVLGSKGSIFHRLPGDFS